MFPLPSQLVLLPTIAFVGALLGTACVRLLARRYGWMAQPRADRWHRKPTALHGGVGFCPVFFGGVVWVVAWRFQTLWSGGHMLSDIPSDLTLAVGLFAGSLLMFCVGWLDDLRQFRPATKLLCQLVAASLFVYMGGVFPLTNVQVLNLLLTYCWFVGITNAVNMLDNMDGLASGVVILAGITLVILAGSAHGLTLGGVLAVPLGLVFVATLLGFWAHNRPPAAIFMGDSGSLCIGYTLAALAVPSPLNGFMGIHTGGTVLGPVLALLIPATVLAIPIFDTTLVSISRLRRGLVPFASPGKDHTAHRLVVRGFSHRRAVLTLYALGSALGIAALKISSLPVLPSYVIFAAVLVSAAVGIAVLESVPFDKQQGPQWDRRFRLSKG